MPKRKKEKNKNRLAFFNQILILAFIFLLPTQFGKHFFLPFSFLSGVRVDYLAPTIYLTDLILLLIIFFNIRYVIKFFQNRTLLISLFLLLITSVFALSKEVGLFKFIKIAELLAVFSIFLTLKIDVKKIVNTFFASALFTATLATFQFINKSSLQGLFYFFGERYLSLSTPDVAKASLQGVEFLRPYAAFSHPNSMAGFFLIVYLLALLSNHKSLLKNFLIFISALIIFLSFSKIAILALIVTTLLYFANQWQKIDCKLCISSRIIVLVVLGLIFSAAQTDPATVQKRVELLENAFQVIKSSPLLGVGPGNYIIAQSKFAKQLFVLTQPVHNIFVLFLAETGLAVGGFILFQLFNYFKKYLYRLDFVLIVIAVVITGFFDHYWWSLQQNFLLLGVAFGLILNRSALFSRPR